LVYAGVGDLASPIQTIMTPNKRQEEYMFQQYMKWIKLVLVITCIISMAHSVENNDFEQIVDGRLHDGHDPFTFFPES
jgi:hypothetical protein